MDGTPQHMPPAVVGAAVPVFIYSLVCLCFGLTLVAVLWKTRDGFSYVLLIAISVTCNCLVSIMQQANYMANWHHLRIQQYEQTVAAEGNPVLALGPLSRGFNAALFWCSIYFYNVDSLTFVFWAIALVINVWNLKYKWMKQHGGSIGIVSKVVAVVLPAILSGLRNKFVGFIGSLILGNILMFGSIGVGALCLISILVKYLNSRLGLFSYGSNTGSKSYNTTGRGTLTTEGATTATKTTRARGASGLKSRVDTLLVVRFSVAFVVLSGFEIFLIEFQINRYHKSLRENIITAPDFSSRASIIDILNYIPGVTASLLAFLLFGITAQQRSMYPAMFRSLNPFNMRKRLSQRISGTQQWKRMDSQDAARLRAEDIEMQRTGVKKTVTMQVTSVDGESDGSVDGDAVAHGGRASISRQFAGHQSWKVSKVPDGHENAGPFKSET